MKIQLIRFGHCDNKTMTFPTTKFILFDGPNGSGKSTIFKAVCFALFEKFKTIKKGEESCQVILTLGNATISRVSKPKTLNLTIGDQKYHGSTAQDVIQSQVIGMNWEQFQYSTMINTSLRCSLASVTSGERFKIVQDLVSTLDEPKSDLAKLIAYEKNLEMGTNVSSGQIELLQSQIAKIEIEPTKEIAFDPEAFQRLKERLAKKKDKREQWLEITASGLTKDVAEQRLEQLDAVPRLDAKVRQYKANLQYIIHMNEIKRLKADFEKNKIYHFKRLQSELDEIDKRLQDVDIDKLKVWARETEVRKDARDDDDPLFDAEPDVIKEAHALLCFKRVKCPECKHYIGVDVSSSDATPSKDKSLKTRKWKDGADEGKSTTHLERLATLTLSWDETAPDKWNKAVGDKMKQSELKRMIDNQVLSPELIRTKKSFGEDFTPPVGLKKTYTVEYLEERIEETLKQIGSAPSEDERDVLETIVGAEVYPTRDMINKITAECKSLEEQLDEMRVQFEQYTRYQMDQRVRDQRAALTAELEETVAKAKKMNGEKVAIERLKQLQREAETMSMEHVIDTLNAYASEYLEKFFDDTIKAELIQYKKTSKNVKLSIEMDVEKNGHKYEVHEFSQGEGIKINLAFILAMNRLVGSKWLFLDEVLQHLDKDITLEIYSCLSSLCSDQGLTIFVIQQNPNHGFFDETFVFGG